MRSPSASPGPRNDRPEVRFALSYDALKMNGTPQPRGDRRELGGEIGRVLLALDDARAADEHERAPAADRDVANLNGGTAALYRAQAGARRTVGRTAARATRTRSSPTDSGSRPAAPTRAPVLCR